MNTPGRIKFSQLPVLSEVDDSDEVLFRDVDGEDPAQQVGRLSIATLRAAMGGGADDWSEFPATSSVDMDGHGLTNLPAPSAASDAATKGYVDSKVASMPAPPDLEWWEPVWTPVDNVDSVSNVECQYTRVHRAAGGSLVTLEGTIEVTPEAGGARSTASVSLPIPRVGTDIIGGVASFTDYDGDDFGIARVGIADLGAGQQLTVQYTPDTDAVHRVSFRLSYRAA